MDDGLKQRLIGAFVLLALAVIFIPVVFDRERIEPVDKTTQIPLAPEIEPVIIEKAIPQPEVEHPAKSAEEIYIPDETQEESLEPEPEPTSVDENGAPESWVLQVASFREEKRGLQLRDTLIKDGYSAYTKNVKTDKGQMTRLYVGPKLNKSTLVKQKAEIENKHGVSPLLLKFKP